MKPRSFVFAAVKLGVAVMMVQATVAGAAEIRVMSSNGVKSVLEELVPEFERASGHKLVFAWGTANALAERIKGGETADLAILTAPLVDELTKLGKLAAGSSSELVRAGIGVAVRAGAPKPDIGTTEAFKRAMLDAKSIAYVGAGQSGRYFAGLTERLGIAAPLKAKTHVVTGGSAVEFVAGGGAELAVQLIPEIISVSGAEFASPLPPELQNYIVFSAGVFAGSAQVGPVQALVRFLSTPAAARVIKTKGMEPI